MILTNSLLVGLGLAVLAAAPHAQESSQPRILPLRERAELRDRWLLERLDRIVPELMRREEIDCWVLVAREYNEDPVVETMLPARWLNARRRTVLVFHDAGEGKGVERFAVARYGVGSAFPAAWDPELEPDQWGRLAALVSGFRPRRIALNVSPTFALADGLSASERETFLAALPESLRTRVVSGENLAVGWLETRLPAEMELYPKVCALAHGILADGFRSVKPGSTTTDDLAWWYRERVAELKLGTWFHPDVTLQRAGREEARDGATRPAAEVIQRGDLVHVDFGITYLGLHTDTQWHAYVLPEGEKQAPAGLRAALAQGNQVQDLLTANFVQGRSGNEILAATLARAREQELAARVYSHPLGLHGHAAGPTIGLWDRQAAVPGPGDYPLHANTAYAIELRVDVAVPEWGGQTVAIMLEEDAFFDGKQVRFLDGRQTELFLIP